MTRWLEPGYIESKEDNLVYALDFLKRLNALVTKDGVPIYDVWHYKSYSYWSFFQQDLFWGALRSFARIKPFLPQDPQAASRQISSLFPAQNGSIKAELSLAISSRFARAWSRLSALLIRRDKTSVLLYTPDKFRSESGCDFRFAPVYEELRRREQPFLETFHTLLGQEFRQNFWSRRRRAIYLDAFRFLAPKSGHIPELNLQSLDEAERIFVSHLLPIVAQAATQSARMISEFIGLFRQSHLKILIAMDDVRQTNELIIACRELGIKTIGIQHGHFTKYLVGWMNYGIPANRAVTFDTLYLWNDYWKQVLFDYSSQYTEKNIKIGGVLRPPKELQLAPVSVPSKFSDLRILVASEPLSNKREVGQHIDAMIEKGATVLLTIRPDASLIDPLKPYQLRSPEKVQMVTRIDAEILGTVHAVAGTYSTFLNEVLANDRPVLVLDTSLDHGHRLIEDGLAFRATIGDEQGILGYLKTWTSKKSIVWPTAPVFQDTLKSILDVTQTKPV